jgi:hypothetical protein
MLTFSPTRRADVLAELEHWEERTNYLYLDNATPANVTVGVGCLLRSPVAACDLPLLVAPTGRRATEDEKTREFLRVKAMQGGRPARTYQARDPALVLYLSDDDVTALAMRRLDRALMDLEALLPGFSDYPEPAQDCLIDLRWNLGLGNSKKGLVSFHDLLGACRRGDWATAARECHVSTSRESRNLWRAQRFIQCVV